MQSNFIYFTWIYELVPAVLTSIQLAFVRIKWWSPSEKYSMLVIISILLTNLESLNKTEIKQMAVSIVNKNKKKRKDLSPVAMLILFKWLMRKYEQKVKKITHLSDLALAKGHGP